MTDDPALERAREIVIRAAFEDWDLSDPADRESMQNAITSAIREERERANALEKQVDALAGNEFRVAALEREVAEQASRETAWATKFEDQLRHYSVRLENITTKRDEVEKRAAALEAALKAAREDALLGSGG